MNHKTLCVLCILFLCGCEEPRPQMKTLTVITFETPTGWVTEPVEIIYSYGSGAIQFRRSNGERGTATNYFIPLLNNPIKG